MRSAFLGIVACSILLCPPALEGGGFSSPVEFRSEAERAAYLRHLRNLLQLGRDAGTDRLQVVGSHVTAARRICPDDPRLDYAHGLVLLKHHRHEEAVERFTAAMKSERLVYLPSWQARIRMALLLRDGTTALDELKNLARAVRDESICWPDKAGRTAAVTWIGRVIGYCDLPGTGVIGPDELVEYNTQLRSLLPSELRPAFENGRRTISVEYDRLQKEIKETRGAAEERQQQQADKKLSRLEQRRQALDLEAENVQMTSEEWDAWLEERLEQFSKQLEVLHKDYQVLDQTAKVLTAQMLQIQREINLLQTRAETTGRRGPRGRAVVNPQAEAVIGRRREELAKCQLQQNRLQARGQDVLSQAAAALALRQAAVARYQQATGRLAKQDATVQKWNRALERSAAEVSTAVDKEPLETRLMKQRQANPSTYFELDFEAEAQRILDSYGDLPSD